MINHLLLGKKIKPTNRSSKNAIIHIPSHTAGKMSAGPHEDLKTKLNSPWRTHIRVHRKNMARARGQLGYADTIGLIEEQSEGCKNNNHNAKEENLNRSEPREKEESDSDARTARKTDGQSPKPTDQDASANANISPIQQKLEALEITQTDSNDSGSLSSQFCQAHISELPNLPEDCAPVAKSPQANNHKPQVFSPFPSVKPLRKSAAARNLGLYGPTERTPTVHFPQMSRSFNKPTSGNSGPKKR